MSEPSWQESVRQAYLSDQASVFIFCGPGVAEAWTLEDQPVGFAEVLIDFLARTREIVGRLAPPRGLSFPGLGDVGHFDRLLAAAHLLDGQHFVLQDDVPEDALGKIWIALSQAAAQGYVIEALDAIYPAQRKHPPALGADAPPLWEWCTHDRIRRANPILFLISAHPDQLRQELVQAAYRIDLPAGSARICR